MKNNKGFAEVAILYAVIAVMAVMFIPNNPVGNALGIVQKPNKIVQSKETILIKDENGKPYAYQTTIQDKDIQQHVGFWEWLKSLPFMVILLMGLGIIFPPVALVLGNIYRGLKAETKRIVVSVDKALSKVKDDATKETILTELEKAQDQSTKDLVDKIQGKK